jgi:thiosulfate/3-mercaptopyruvate sulfurtransferase
MLQCLFPAPILNKAPNWGNHGFGAGKNVDQYPDEDRPMSYANTQLLTEPEDLAGMQDDPDLRVFDATVFLVPAKTGYRAESGVDRYREGHVPGAVFLDLIGDFSDRSSRLGFTLPGVDALTEAMQAHGIGDQHRVVLYSSGHTMWATRAFWLLRYVGHERVSVLHGGLAGWRAAGGTLRSGDERYPAAPFTPRPRPELFVDKAGMLAALDDTAVCTINALSPEVYAGTGDMHYGRRGHIPGSRNLHYDRLMDGHRFRPADALRAALAESGMLDAERVVTYCGGGISATIDAFACLLLGLDNVAVYDGSMSEWVRDESLPLTVGDRP